METTQLTNQIIQDLINPEKKLQDIFLKVKVLAFELENQNITDWTEKEINGYKNDDNIPEYRKIPCVIHGNLLQDIPYRVAQVQNAALSIDHLPDEIRKTLNETSINSSISEIEHMIAKGNNYKINIPYWIQAQISETLPNNWFVQGAWRVIPSTYLEGILGTIKSNLLDFLMPLNKELGTGNILLMENSKTIDDLFKNTIGSIQGKNVTVNFGNNNQNLYTGEIKNSTISQNKSNNISVEEMAQIRDLVSKIKTDFDQYIHDDYREVIANQIQIINHQLDKPSPIRLIINVGLKTIYDLLVEAAGSAYSPIILDQIRNLLR